MRISAILELLEDSAQQRLLKEQPGRNYLALYLPNMSSDLCIDPGLSQSQDYDGAVRAVQVSPQ